MGHKLHVVVICESFMKMVLTQNLGSYRDNDFNGISILKVDIIGNGMDSTQSYIIPVTYTDMTANSWKEILPNYRGSRDGTIDTALDIFGNQDNSYS